MVLPLKIGVEDPQIGIHKRWDTDAVIAEFQKIKEMDRVVPFTSSLQFKNSEKKVCPNWQKHLMCITFLEGNFQNRVINLK